ncbi:hypothetical protein [Ligilactobacillus cholophilus]|uniref:hypothetical protein n=1 Tax=Ligilactobacillus cholophilus TaxID=3050131 RepID=UPI0025B0F183|nr:hypothetical protein [Ligilactobacillus cholophilus]
MVKKYEKRKELVDIVQYIANEFIFYYVKDTGENPPKNEVEEILKKTLEENNIKCSSAEYHGMLIDLLPSKPKRKRTRKNKQRTKLKKIGSDERHTFTGVFERTGFKSYKDKYSPTILLKDIKMDNELLADHLWINYGKNFLKLGKLEKGDLIQFDGRVSTYHKGYYLEGNVKDYHIERPTKVKLLSNNHEFIELPTENKIIIGMILTENEKFYSKNNRGTVDDYFYMNCYDKWKESQNKK